MCGGEDRAIQIIVNKIKYFFFIQNVYSKKKSMNVGRKPV